MPISKLKQPILQYNLLMTLLFPRVCHLQTWLLQLHLCWPACCPVKMPGQRPSDSFAWLPCPVLLVVCQSLTALLATCATSFTGFPKCNVQSGCFGLALPDRRNPYLPYGALQTHQQ